MYEIARFLKNGDFVLNNGWVLPRSYGHVAHGYCTTSHASQGMTADTVLISQSAESFRASSSEQFYVSCSRGKTGIKIYTDSVDELFQAVCRSHQQTSAADLMLAEPSSEPLSVRIKLRQKQRTLARQRKASERAVAKARRRRSGLKIAVEQGTSVIASVNETRLKTGIVAGASVIVTRDTAMLNTTAIYRGEPVCAPFVSEAAKPAVAPPGQRTTFVPMFSPEPQSSTQQMSI